MDKVFEISIMTEKAVIYFGKVSSLIAPSVNGYLGVLAHHAPFISLLTGGKITLKEMSGKLLTFDMKGSGFLHVLNNNVTILCSGVENIQPAVPM